MFGIKIISEEKYQSEQRAANKLIGINEELTKKNAGLELDIKSLREQNSKLRALNGKLKAENESLAGKYSKLKPDEVSLNFNNGSYKITFNRFATQDINKAEMTFARLAKNKLGDICLILNRKEGTKLSVAAYNNGKKDNITLNSKEITTKIRTLLNIKPDYSILNIERLASTSDYIIYKLTKQ